MTGQQFNWRPNDRSGLTLIRYRLEAQRWYDTVSDISKQNTRRVGSISSSFDFITSILGLVFCVVLLILLGILSLIKLLLGSNKNKYRDTPTTRKDYSDKLMRMPVREDYPNEDDYYDVLGAYIMSRKADQSI